MAIYLIRHGESVGNAEGFFQGTIDCELTPTGKQQARALGGWLAAQGIKPDTTYCSPLKRAAQTAEIVCSTIGIPAPITRSELKEFSAGVLEGLLPHQIEEKFPEYIVRGLDERGDFSKFGGESYESMNSRLGQFITYVLGSHNDDDELAVVSHGGALYQLIKQWCGWPAPRHFFTRISNCCCCKLQLRGIAEGRRAELQWFLPLEMMTGDSMQKKDPARSWIERQ